MTKPIEWNKVIYADCMNEENGLSTLEDKSIDLCLTDPPFSVNFKDGKEGYKNHRRMINYDDKYSFEWHIKWFNEILRICNGIMVYPGLKLFYDFIQYKKPNYTQKIIYMPNVCGYFHAYYFLPYGKIKNINKIRDIKEIPMNLSKAHKGLIHPSPKPFFQWEYILKKLNPLSVIDPFLGSGTTAEVCTKLGIKWLGYEINEVYSQDINKRLKNCKKEPQQITLEGFKR
ncbi:MAG: hypothetical protein EU548_03575 [Promethearchaeota archaeon]|nr:MAG: hypothetical protein EU548_03575 [Candidatus Lokiarchaeota archaeon]